MTAVYIAVGVLVYLAGFVVTYRARYRSLKRIIFFSNETRRVAAVREASVWPLMLLIVWLPVALLDLMTPNDEKSKP